MGADVTAQEDNLLIAMSNTAASLKLVRSLSARLADPRHTHVTLMHYLMPVYWEHEADLSNGRELQEVLREEEQALRIEGPQKEHRRDYFQEARMTLEEAGVPDGNIQTRMIGDGMNAAHTLLQEVEGGKYTAVVVGEHHQILLEQLLNRPIAGFMEKHARGAKIWNVPQPYSARS